MNTYIVVLKFSLLANCENYACDSVSSILSENDFVFDWGYLKQNNSFAYFSRLKNDNIFEGIVKLLIPANDLSTAEKIVTMKLTELEENRVINCWNFEGKTKFYKDIDLESYNEGEFISFTKQ